MKVLSISELNDVRHIISKFETLTKDSINFPKTLIDMVRDWLQAGVVKIGLKMNSDSTVIGLAVTLSNPAKYLYEKQGFEICDEFSSIVYAEK